MFDPILVRIVLAALIAVAITSVLIWIADWVRSKHPRRYPYPSAWKRQVYYGRFGMMRQLDNTGSRVFAYELPKGAKNARVIEGHQVVYGTATGGVDSRFFPRYYPDDSDYPVDEVYFYPDGQPEALPDYQTESNQERGV